MVSPDFDDNEIELIVRGELRAAILSYADRCGAPLMSARAAVLESAQTVKLVRAVQRIDRCVRRTPEGDVG
jgi:hypothetical protein